MKEMKENLKEIILMGLGAISLTGEKAVELKKELMEKGEALYKEGSIKNISLHLIPLNSKQNLTPWHLRNLLSLHFMTDLLVNL